MTLVLEIGSPWLKIALFQTAMGRLQVKGVSAVKMTSLAENAISSEISGFLKSLKIKKPSDIIVSFSRSAVTLRNLRIPSVNPSEISDMIKLHVGRQVPYAKEEIVSGYRVIGQDATGYSRVMLAVVHREGIRKIFRILENAEIYTDRVELSSDGVLSWFIRAAKIQPAKEPEAFIILDMDAQFTDFLIATHEKVLFSRVITIGAEQLSDESRLQRMIGEMKQTMVISQGEEVAQKPLKVYLTGCAGQVSGLSSRIEAEFGLPVESVETFANLSVAKDVVKTPPELFDQVSMCPLLGLGLDAVKKKINFVLPEAQIRKSLKERSRDMIFFGSGVMYFIIIICGLYVVKMHNRQSYLSLLEEHHKTVAVESKALSEKVERIKKIKSKLDIDALFISYFHEISKRSPKVVTVTKLDFQRNEKVSLKGYTQQMSDVFNFIALLEESPYFKDIQSRYMRRKDIQGQSMTEFELICPFENVSQEDEKKKKA